MKNKRYLGYLRTIGTPTIGSETTFSFFSQQIRISNKIQNGYHNEPLFILTEYRTICILEKQTENLVPPSLFPKISLFLTRCKIKCYSTMNVPYRCHHLFNVGRASPRQNCEGKD